MKRITTLILFIVCLNCFANHYCVNSNLSTGANNGSSWINAFFNLQSALDSAKSGDTIRIATGVYRPNGNSNASGFNLRYDVILLGGYAPGAGDTTDARRNWVTHPVTLNASLVGGGTADNLIFADGLAGLVLLDGFIIRGAYNYGVRVVSCGNVVIKNSIIQDHFRMAISVEGSNAAISNCVFRNNNYGITVNNASVANTNLYNCIFTNNNASDQYVIQNLDANINIINCTIVNNTGTAFYGNGGGSATIRNSIFWNNRSPLNSMEETDIKPTNQTIQVRHCITQTYYDSATNSIQVASNPRFVNIVNPAGPDNQFFTQDDGLQLAMPCSPGLNTGNNASASTMQTDILGQPRVYNSGIVDLGAYEKQITPGSVLRTVYVNSANTTGSNDGSSWQNAFKTLQDALSYCADTIKVAAGVYFTSNSYNDSVFIIENRRVILGGYPQVGNPSDADRNPASYLTMLKGNYSGTYSGLSYPVLKSYGNDTSTIIDGLVFDNEYTTSANMEALRIGYSSRLKVLNCSFAVSAADGVNSTGVRIIKGSNPMFFRCKFSTYSRETGGIAVGCESNSSPKISFCDFVGERASSQRTSQAISLADCSISIDSCVFRKKLSSGDGNIINSSNSNVVISRCTLSNSGNNNGQLLYMMSNSGGVINNCVFENNFFGGVKPSSIYNDNSSPVFSHCLFDSSLLHVENINRSAPVFNNCVGINGRFMKNTQSFPVINNSTITNTYATFAITSSEEELIINSDSSVFRANNTIFWSNRLAAGRKDIDDRLGTTAARNSISILMNCLTQNYGLDGVNGNIVGLNPRFMQLADIDGRDNLMFTSDDGLRLARCSPAINSGRNTAGIVLSTDVLQNQRIYNGTVDMGAYELQDAGALPSNYYVNSNATGNNDGTSWQNAYMSLQDAVCNTCADTIRVASGVYKAALSARDSSFLINRGVTLYGGYPASGNPADDVRDPDNNPTVLSGNIGNLNDSLDNTRNIIQIIGIKDRVKDTVLIDGFVIRDGNCEAGGVNLNLSGGAGVYSYYNNCHIRNCRFMNNRASPSGGAIYIAPLGYFKISHAIFFNNSSTNYGGAVWSQGALKVSGTVFENNYSWGEGGAIRVKGSCDINNTVFYKNYTTATNAEGNGGAVNAASSGGGEIYNCDFVENRTTFGYLGTGGGLYTNQSLSVNVKNCIFSGNRIGNSTTSAGSDFDCGYYVIKRCLLQTACTFNDNISQVSANFVDSLNPKGPDGKWLTNDDGLQLNFNSPVINYGINSIVADLPSDILGSPRIVGDTVDAGAYEYQNKPIANAGADTTICYGTTVQIGKSNNPNHIYSWTSNPSGFVSSAALPVVSPTVQTTYFLQVSNGSTTAKDTVTVSLSSSLVPSAIIAASASDICQGTNVSFTAIPRNEGGNPTYQWQLNGANTGTNSSRFATSALSDGDQVRVQLTSSAGCANPNNASSNIITMTVHPTVAPAVSVTPSKSSVCLSDTVVFTANAINGGTFPYYTWIKGGVVVQRGQSNTYSENYWGNGNSVWVILTSNASCANPCTDTSGQAVLTVNYPASPSVFISATATTICRGGNVTFTALPTRGGTAPTYQWKRNGINVGTNSANYSSTVLQDGDVIFVALTSNDNCVTTPTVSSNSITMKVNATVVPSITISGNTIVSQGQSTGLTATIANGGVAPIIQWQDSVTGWQNIAGATLQTLNYTPTANGSKARCVMTSSDNCATPKIVTSAPLTFTVNTPTAVNPVPGLTYQIRLYPNPTNSRITVDSLKLFDKWTTLDIIAVDGKRLLAKSIAAQTTVVVDVTHLLPGVYFIILRKKSGEAAYLKFEKQ